MNDPAQIRFPPLTPQTRNLMIGLLAAYVLELILANSGFPVYSLAWQPTDFGFQPWQPLTRFLVQGRGALTVVFGLLALYFFVGPILESLSRVAVRNALIAGLLGGTLATGIQALSFGTAGMVAGWTTTVIVSLLVLFGLTSSQATIYLFFVIPVSARFLMYATGVMATLRMMIDPTSLGTAEGFGVFFGVIGWWYGLGPGARRRDLKKKSRKIEDELRRFEVIEGGRSQGDQGNRDEWVH